MITVDSNVILRFLLGDIPDHAERSKRLFQQANPETSALFIPATAIAEVSYVLTRLYNTPRARAADALMGICQLFGVEIENRNAIEAALAFWRANGGLSFVDCYHLALTEHMGLNQIYSFDKKMGRYPGVERIEP